MKDKGKSSNKRGTRSGGTRRAVRPGPSGGMAGSGGVRSAGRTAISSAPAQVEARFQAVFEGSRDAIGVSKAGVHVLMNPAYRALFGVPPEADLAGTPILNLIAPERRDQVKEYVARRERGESVPAVYETRGLRVDGSEFDMEVSASLYREGEEKLTLVILRNITERKMAAQENAERSAMLQQIMDTASVAIGLVDKTGRITHANRRMAEMFGRSLEELAGCEYVELVHPSERETGRKNMLALLASEIPAVDLERLYWKKDGTEFWGHLACRRFHDVHGNELGLIGVISDITERKRTEQALRESEERYRQLFEAESDAIFLIDNETGRILMANNAAVALYGYDREELLEKKNTDLSVEPSETRRITEETPIIKENAITIPLRHHRKKDGTVFPVEITGRFFTYRERPVHIAAIRDITERKRAEEEIAERGALLQQILDTSSVAIFLVDKAGRITQANRRMAEMFGRAMEELVGREYVELVHPSERETGRKMMLALLASEIQSVDLERHYWRKEGTEFWGHLAGRRFHDVHGNELGLIGVISDVTERKRAEDACRESERSLITLMGNLPGMAYRCRNDQDWTMEYVNEGVRELTGYQPSDLVGNAKVAYNDLIDLEDKQAVWDAVQKSVQQKQKFTMNYRIRTADGRKKWVWEQGQGVFSEAGDLLALEGFIIDVSERRLLEEERHRAQKLESVGTLAGGIAHDFNNLLQGIFGYISMAKLTIDQKEKALAMLEQAEKAMHQSVSLTSQLLTFSKGGKPVKKVLALQPIIENAVKFSLSGSRVNHTISFADDLPMVEADEGQIMQVVQNIVLNADQAMPEGGTIAITARNVAVHGPGIPAGLAPGDYVSLAVQDSGVGIPERYLTKIFDPYFSTKEKGSGLGLATSYSIIKNHGGVIDVSSAPGKGTIFTVYLPATRAARHKTGPSAAAGRTVGRTCRVLVMDDEQLVRVVAGELLRELGHEVEFAEHGDAAIGKYRLAKAEGRPFDLVILDLTIRGGKGGAETLRELLKIDPGVKAVVSSGYSDNAETADYKAHGFRAFLKKPYDMRELGRVLNEVMA